MSRRQKKKLKRMHPVPLFSKALGGDRDAVSELIERQQNGKALRYYPNGRSSMDDDGAVVASVRPANGVVEIRSGRPWSMLNVSQEVAFDWIIGIPRCLSVAIHEYTSLGMSHEDVCDQMRQTSTKDFEARISAYYGDDSVQVAFSPAGHKAWRLDPVQCASLVKAIAEACMMMDWQYHRTASNHDLSLIHSLIKDVDTEIE